ncbi:hypothetical protein [Flavilitoribacter nigricans]|uniref:Uncharacterized protein n=1 Tax=Flavilitoribacter nigricans (strain ATCC 23147 / DSM 23189 / NBRC 102662 / NCIMB 1420 / SS-2) TaxID=1122177 RepID=A0A2D0N745_FLAN2|nr:hypothetical protein [Flavilitoribacter nigricans]PHN04334.1 hypothetical protein CRP01_22495 [Flavilitoribacter nigricans DSM 23189 = NBRC 102662]
MTSATFYGVTLDKNDPFLDHNLDRLEKRFRERYFASLEKNRKREQGGKPPHQMVLKSMEDNKNRFLMVKLLRSLLLEEEVHFEF